jgi:alcohol dehydrogenase
LELCQEVVSVAGHIANIGVHGKPVTLHMEKLWDRNITLTTRLVDTVTIPVLLKVLLAGRLDAKKLSRHRFPLSDVIHAYDVFGHAAKEKALKVILKGA